MRWEALFADLEAQAAAASRAAFDGEVAELTRAERGRVGLAQRLRAATGTTVVCLFREADPVAGRLVEVGADFVLLDDGGGVLVPFPALLGVEGLGRAADADRPGSVSGVGFAVALRALARDRAAVRVFTAGADPVAGTIDRVGADHLDLARHPVEEPRRRSAVRGVRTVPFWAVTAIRQA